MFCLVTYVHGYKAQLSGLLHLLHEPRAAGFGVFHHLLLLFRQFTLQIRELRLQDSPKTPF